MAPLNLPVAVADQHLLVFKLMLLERWTVLSVSGHC